MGSQKVGHDRVTFTFKANLTGLQERFKKIIYLKASSTYRVAPKSANTEEFLRISGLLILHKNFSSKC